MTYKSRTVVILAGGKSERFQDPSRSIKDKAVEDLHGKTLLENIVKITEKVADETLVTVNNGERMKKYKQILRENCFKNVNVLVDEAAPCGGPLRGIMTGMKCGKGDLLLTLPCDAPLIKSAVLKSLFKLLGENKAAAPIWPNGCLEPLFGVFKRRTIAPIAEALCKLGRSRPDDLFRSASRVTLISILEDLKPLDPSLDSFVNINHPDDLVRLPKPNAKGRLFKKTVHLKSPLERGEARSVASFTSIKVGSSNIITKTKELIERLIGKNVFFWPGVMAESRGRALLKSYERMKDGGKDIRMEAMKSFRTAAECFDREAKSYLNRKALSLAAHTMIDEKRCWRKAGYEEPAFRTAKQVGHVYSKMGIN